MGSEEITEKPYVCRNFRRYVNWHVFDLVWTVFGDFPLVFDVFSTVNGSLPTVFFQKGISYINVKQNFWKNTHILAGNYPS